MKIYFLKDISKDCVDAVIIAEASTKEDIKRAIHNAKELNPDEWTWEDIINALPSDCQIHDRWSNECVYY